MEELYGGNENIRQRRYSRFFPLFLYFLAFVSNDNLIEGCEIGERVKSHKTMVFSPVSSHFSVLHQLINFGESSTASDGQYHNIVSLRLFAPLMTSDTRTLHHSGNVI